MPDETLHAHSLTEARLYLAVTPCSICKHGATEPSEPDPRGDRHTVRFITTCKNCGGSDEYIFDVPGDPALFDDQQSSAPAPINSTRKPSRIIDVTQWLTLHHLKVEEASREPDKGRSRRLNMEAGQCLTEALRFYDKDNDLPGPDAFFSDRSRQTFHDHAQRYARQRLVGLVARLPKPDITRSKPARKRPWWKWW